MAVGLTYTLDGAICDDDRGWRADFLLGLSPDLSSDRPPWSEAKITGNPCDIVQIVTI